MDASILAWFQIANMVSTIPTEHKLQTEAYKEQMLCLKQKRCYSFLDTRDNTWVIRKVEPVPLPLIQECMQFSQSATNHECKIGKEEDSKIAE